MSNYFIYDGVDSRDYGIEVFFVDVDSIPRRVYEKVEVAGRNGSMFLDKGRYEDQTHIYDCIAVDDNNRQKFLEAISAKIGYHRLEDSFHEDEYYSAILIDRTEPKVLMDRDSSTFRIEFTRKPQRFLKEGEKELVMDGQVYNIKSVSGNPAVVDIDSTSSITGVIVEYSPIQDLSHGDPSPTNICPISGWTEINVDRYRRRTDGLPGFIRDQYSVSLEGKEFFSYGGTVDLISGKVLSRWNYISSYSGQTLPAEWISDRDVYEEGKTPTTGAQVAYKRTDGAASTTVTPVDIPTYEGENSFETDSKNVEVKYGTNGNLLVNPTPFTSKPLITIGGYGKTHVGDYEIEIENLPYGELTLFNADETESNNITIAPLNVPCNDGDSFNVSQVLFSFSVNSLQAQITNIAVTSAVGAASEAVISKSWKSKNGVITIMLKDQAFAVGTKRLVSGRIDVGVTVYDPSGATISGGVSIGIQYLDNGRIKFYCASTTQQEDYVTITPTSIKWDAIVVDSTASTLETPINIDCEIGEAYTVIDGEIVPMNSIISLGGDTPELIAGTSEVSYDETIESVKIVPRWWKI